MFRSILLDLTALLVLATTAAAQPSSNLADYVLFASTTLKTKGPTIADGDVGVNAAGGRLLAPRTFTAPNSVVAADRVKFDPNPSNTVLQQLYANIVEQFGPAGIPFGTPIIADVKAACGFPPTFPTCAAGMDVEVSPGTTTPLAPGSYGKVRVHGSSLSAGVLVLTGGTYTFCDLKVARNGQLRVQAPSTINVAGKATFGPNTVFGPDTGSGLVANDIHVYVAGSIVKLSRGSFSEAHMCIPDGKLKMSKGGTHIGTHVASYIRIQAVTLDVGSPSGAFVE